MKIKTLKELKEKILKLPNCIEYNNEQTYAPIYGDEWLIECHNGINKRNYKQSLIEGSYLCRDADNMMRCNLYDEQNEEYTRFYEYAKMNNGLAFFIILQ